MANNGTKTDTDEYLMTFAMPYMNGPLHMGHFFTLMKAELASRYHEMRSQCKVLFPFAFHCTGMPIYASAHKLRNGDATVQKVLLDSGVPEDHIDKFQDPEHWIKYFPTQALETLSDPRLQLNTDFSRSFVTTSINPYYDSFVRWQYKKLREYMKFEGRYCIYSLKDKQPCADHDRQTGEGVAPVPYMLHITGNTFCIVDKDHKHIYSEGQCYVKVGAYHGYMPKLWLSNLCAQRNTVEELEVETEPYRTDVVAYTGITIYIPETEVISRSGDVCVVALTDQWYISYSDAVWKERVLQCIDKMTVYDDEVRKQLVIAANNLHDWCVSREYGLGTRLPWDERFLIDSLSDSTLYMAYYTVCHLLHSDIYGQKPSTKFISQISPDKCDETFWDQVFLNNEKPESDIICVCRASFQRHYPVALRVSGKDLIYNHLIMSIYHHVAVFGEEYVPREYAVNGYVTVDGKKMSKSLGNFITVQDLLEDYDPVTIRVMLTEAGDGINDANIRMQLYPSTHKAVQCLMEWHKANPVPDDMRLQIDQYLSMQERDIASDVFFYQLLDALHRAERSYTVGRFREAITEGWRKTTKYFTTYQKEFGKATNLLTDMYSFVQLFTMLPVIPNISRIDTDTIQYLLSIPTREHVVKGREYCSEMESKIHKGKYDIKIHQKVVNSSSYETIKAWLDTQCTYTVTIDATELHPSRDPFKVKPVITETP